MLDIREGTEVLLKTGEFVTVVSGYSSWRGQRWTGAGRIGGQDIQREFSDDDVRAVLGQGRDTARSTSAPDPDSQTLF